MPLDADEQDGGGGRRGYDSGPLAVLRAELMREIEVTATRTRHGLREEFGATLMKLEATVAQAQAQATTEHGTALAAISELSTDLRLMKRDLDEVMPLIPAVSELQRHDDVDEARSTTRKELGSAFVAQRIAQRNWNLAVLTVLVAILGLILTQIHFH